MKKTLKINIYSLAFGAKGVGKTDGKVAFVEGALPGEEVIFRVTKETDNYIEGELEEIITASQHRVNAPCPYYGACNGCQLQHVTYEQELVYKKAQVAELIERISGLKNINISDIVPSREHYNYRSAITLHCKDKKIGFFGKDGRNIIEIEECLLAEKSINAKIQSQEFDEKEKDVTLKADHKGNVWSSNKMGERFYLDKYCGTEMYLSPKAFSQANRFISEKIAERLKELISGVPRDAVFFDAYCGAGFFSFLVNGAFNEKIGIDDNRVAIDCAKTTVKKNGLQNIKFYKLDVEKKFFDIFEQNKGVRNVLFIDPPRAGAKKEFLEKVSELKDINKLYYLSCDPARLARDIKILTGKGLWRVAVVIPFDMFPRTKHIEALVEFEKIV